MFLTQRDDNSRVRSVAVYGTLLQCVVVCCIWSLSAFFPIFYIFRLIGAMKNSACFAMMISGEILMPKYGVLNFQKEMSFMHILH